MQRIKTVTYAELREQVLAYCTSNNTGLSGMHFMHCRATTTTTRTLTRCAKAQRRGGGIYGGKNPVQVQLLQQGWPQGEGIWKIDVPESHGQRCQRSLCCTFPKGKANAKGGKRGGRPPANLEGEDEEDEEDELGTFGEELNGYLGVLVADR